MGKMSTEREKEGLLKRVHSSAVIETLIIEEKYHLIGFASYLYLFPAHLYRELEDIIISTRERKS